jgi:hypothetical protein
MGENAQGPPVERKPCRHDSTRGDGWLDTHCLRCGAEGYWKAGYLAVEAQHHPGGKLLLRPSVGPDAGRERHRG